MEALPLLVIIFKVFGTGMMYLVVLARIEEGPYAKKPKVVQFMKRNDALFYIMIFAVIFSTLGIIGDIRALF